MDALPIVVALDVGEQVASGLVPGRPSSLVDEFDLEGMKEAFHRGVGRNSSLSGSWRGVAFMPASCAL